MKEFIAFSTKWTSASFQPADDQCTSRLIAPVRAPIEMRLLHRARFQSIGIIFPCLAHTRKHEKKLLAFRRRAIGRISRPKIRAPGIKRDQERRCIFSIDTRRRGARGTWTGRGRYRSSEAPGAAAAYEPPSTMILPLIGSGTPSKTGK